VYALAILTICSFEGVIKSYGYGEIASPNNVNTGNEYVENPDSLSTRWSLNIEALQKEHRESEVPSVAISDVEPEWYTDVLPPQSNPTMDPKTQTKPAKAGPARELHDYRSLVLEKDGTPEQRPKRGSAEPQVDEIPMPTPRRRDSHTGNRNQYSYPLFVYLSWLIGQFFLCHSFGERLLRNKHSIVTILMRPMLYLQKKIFTVVIDLTLMALFAASVRHLGHCSRNSGCEMFSLDGSGLCAALGSVIIVLQRRGGGFLLNAIGIAIPAGKGFDDAWEEVEEFHSPRTIPPKTDEDAFAASMLEESVPEESAQTENAVEGAAEDNKESTNSVLTLGAWLLMWPAMMGPVFLTTRDAHVQSLLSAANELWPTGILPLFTSLLECSSFWAVSVLVASGIVCSFIFQSRCTPLLVRARYVVGYIVAIDFALFWAVPMVGQGALYKQTPLVRHLRPFFYKIDRHPLVRRIGSMFYAKEKHADYFLTQFLFVANFACLFVFVTYWQLTHKCLPWWLIFLYNCGWVGLGGRNMGAAYSLAHREGHNPSFYKPWIRNTIGNMFENWIGLVYGNVPYNFSTTHISLHHRLNAGLGDTLYCWDIDRSSWPEYMLYLCRALLHMTGFSALWQFWHSTRKIDRERQFPKLLRGVLYYWVVLPAIVLYLVPSPSYFFWVFLQPLFCMTFFLALVNMGFHVFIEKDENGQRTDCVESLLLIGGDDDYFGEDDHMAHHFHTHVYYRDLEEHHKAQLAHWQKYHASVFQGADILTFSFMVLFKAWPVLAERFVDYSETLSKAEIATMLEVRARRRDTQHTRLLPSVPVERQMTYGYSDTCEAAEKHTGWYGAFVQKSAECQMFMAEQMDKGMKPLVPWKEVMMYPNTEWDH